jgi:hypothetical protein
MTISDVQYAAWWDNPAAQRVTLYRIGCLSGGVQTWRRLSNKPFTGPAAAPYSAAIAKDLVITRSISRDGDAKLSAGDVEVWNVNGELDSWYSDVFVNQGVFALVGDASWDESDFRIEFVGALGGIAPGSDDTKVTLKFRDALQRLNTPVSEAKMADGTLYPVVLGEVANITPKKDAVTGRWYYHCGPAEMLIEPRTDGRKRTADVTDDPANGRFSFNDALGPGALTCSVQGDKTGGIYRNTIASLIQLLATSYGKASTRMTVDDIDTSNFAAFEAANPQPVGLAILDRTNVLTACAQLAASKGAQLIPSMLGKLQLIQYAVPKSATLDIPRSMQVEGTLTLVDISPVAAAVQIGFCRNYTTQSSLQTSLVDEHRQMFATEWPTYTTPVDQATQVAYSWYADPVMQQSCLQRQVDARGEGDRRLAFEKNPHPTYQTQLTPAGWRVQLGEARNLFGDRYQLQNGKPGQVTSLASDFGTYHTVAQVTV